MLYREQPLKHGIVDLAAILFVLGGVLALVLTLLSIPVSSIYPSLTVPATLSLSVLVVLAIGLICSLGALHCASLTLRRMLSEAGIRGVVFGALLLIFSLGFASSAVSNGAVGFNIEQGTATIMKIASAFLILLGGIITFAMRHTSVSASQMGRREHWITQPMQER